MAKKAKRTTHRSSAGKKLYAVRTVDGQFHDIQTFERAHRADLARTAAAEEAGATKKTVKKTAAVKPTALKPTAAKAKAAKTKAAPALATVKTATKRTAVTGATTKKAKKAKK
jgi:hypothetical protein